MGLASLLGGPEEYKLQEKSYNWLYFHEILGIIKIEPTAQYNNIWYASMAFIKGHIT